MDSRQKYILIRTLSNFLILGSITYLLLSFGPIVSAELSYYLLKWRGITYTIEKGESIKKYSPFSYLIGSPTPLRVDPVNKGFSIVIERLGVNAPIVQNVDMVNSKEYLEALKFGVAQAKGSNYPGNNNGVTYLFAHSALDFWNFGKFAMVFTLLNKIELGDKVVIYYEGARFDYKVTAKEVFRDFDLTPIRRSYHEPTLVLQTCDPPGTALNRLIVTASLIR